MKNTELTVGPQSSGFMTIDSLDQALRVSEMIAKSQFCPRQFQNKPGDVLICMQVGQELGLKPMQALQNIAVINGRPSVWGDAVMAICKNSHDFEYINESYNEKTLTATCVAKRNNQPEVQATFSQQDAKTAGLWGKQGPWTQYPQRMLQMRARGFALRDAFPDRLRGIISREEANDIGHHKEVIDDVVSESQLEELVDLAQQAQATPEDLQKATGFKKLEEITYSEFTSLRQRLLKKIKLIQEQEKLRAITANKEVPDVTVISADKNK